MTKQNEQKDNFSNDKVVQTARKIIEAMPPWQQKYANEIIASATQPESPASMTSLPKMLG
jgi:hypothetical protein